MFLKNITYFGVDWHISARCPPGSYKPIELYLSKLLIGTTFKWQIYDADCA
jgi:hypothetical protein